MDPVRKMTNQNPFAALYAGSSDDDDDDYVASGIGHLALSDVESRYNWSTEEPLSVPKGHGTAGKDKAIDVSSEYSVTLSTQSSLVQKQTLFTRLSKQDPSLKGDPSEKALSGHKRGIWRMTQLSPNQIVTCSYDKTARVWDMFKGFSLAKLEGHQAEVLCAAANEESLITGCSAGELRFWNKETFTHEKSFKDPDNQGFYSLQLLLGKRLATGTCQRPDKHKGNWDHDIKIWNLETGFLGRCQGHTGGIPKMVRLEDNYILSCSNDSTLRLWNTITQKQEAIIENAHKHWIYTMCLMEKTAITGGQDKILKAWDTEKMALIRSFKSSGHDNAHESTIFDVCRVSLNVFASSSKDGYVKLWDLRKSDPIKVLDADDGIVYSLCALKDRFIVAGTGGKEPRKKPSLVSWVFEKES